MLSILYNHPTLSSTTDAPIIAEVKDLNSAIAYAAFPGTYLVEFFPWMKYLPSSIAPWKRKAEAHSKRATKTFVDLFLSVDVSQLASRLYPGLTTLRRIARPSALVSLDYWQEGNHSIN